MTSHSSMPTLVAYAEKLEERLRVKMIKIAHYDHCVLIEKAATLALNQFQRRYTQFMMTNDPLLRAEETRLIAAKTKAWNDRFAAESAAYPPTLESILWIVAKSGFTKEVAPFMNLSKATRECKNLQRYMREVRIWGITQLHYFCWKGMTSSVMRMLEMRSIDVEAREDDDEVGETCLHSAAWDGHLDICRLLIDKGAQLEAKNNIGWTPLHRAARTAHVDVCRLLIDKGAQLEAKNDLGNTALHVCVHHAYLNIDGQTDTLRLLLDKGALIEARDSRGNTPLYTAASCDLVEYCRMLIDKGALLEAKGADHKTPLQIAISEGNLEICRLLIDKGAHIEANIDDDGSTPLHLAADCGNFDIVQLLCDHGADIEALNNLGVRPLHYAASRGSIFVVKELIEVRKAEVNARDNGGRTALTWAKENNKAEVVTYLVSLGGVEIE